MRTEKWYCENILFRTVVPSGVPGEEAWSVCPEHDPDDPADSVLLVRADEGWSVWLAGDLPGFPRKHVRLSGVIPADMQKAAVGFVLEMAGRPSMEDWEIHSLPEVAKSSTAVPPSVLDLFVDGTARVLVDKETGWYIRQHDDGSYWTQDGPDWIGTNDFTEARDWLRARCLGQ